jgi:hypothetical protein
MVTSRLNINYKRKEHEKEEEESLEKYIIYSQRISFCCALTLKKHLKKFKKNQSKI